MDPLKLKFKAKAEEVSAKKKDLLAKYGKNEIDTVTVDQLMGGMRDITCMLWETSLLDPMEGIRFRGYSIEQLQELLPKAPGCLQPLPEGLFYLMLIGEIPTTEEVNWISREWQRRSKVPQHTLDILNSLPTTTHPMTQFSIGIMAMQTDSIFASRYEKGMSRADYWDCTYEDTMNLIARLPRIAAYIYRRTYKNDQHIEADISLDWGANFAHMLGFGDKDFKSLMRLYLTLHADHEGGNASAHTTHLVGSTLSDAYFSLAAGMNALAGPLHGLANQEVVRWIMNLQSVLGTKRPSKEQIEEFIKVTLNGGKVIPGYGHAVLRRPDPRFMAQKRFAEQYNLQSSDMVHVVSTIFEVAPAILGSLGKIKNPYPNVDAHSGALLVHYGLTEYNFYTVLFGVSRALGVLAQLCWSRALSLPLERPKSVTLDWLLAELTKTEVATNQ
jgi:citrate synthase